MFNERHMGRYAEMKGREDESRYWVEELEKWGVALPPHRSLVVGRDVPPSREMQLLESDLKVNGSKFDVYFYPNAEEIYLHKK